MLLIASSGPVANYVNAVRAGDLLCLAGKGPLKADNTYVTGNVCRGIWLKKA
jgi:enamine deaminase RidA (YjgF/YER057c/UK114 family)